MSQLQTEPRSGPEEIDQSPPVTRAEFEVFRGEVNEALEAIFCQQRQMIAQQKEILDLLKNLPVTIDGEARIGLWEGGAS